MKTRTGLQFEIVASLFVVVLAGLAIVAVVMAVLATRSVEGAALDQLRSEAQLLDRMRQLGALRLSDLAALTATLPSSGAEWAVFDTRGRPAGAIRAESRAPELAPDVWAALAAGEYVHRGGALGPDVMLIAPLSRVAGESGLLVGRVEVGELRRRLLPLLRAGAWVLASSALVFVAFGAFLLRARIVLRVQELRGAVDKVAAGDLTVRTPETGSDELSWLARGFNQMTASLDRDRRALLQARESLWRSQRLASVGQLAAGVAHEVGNPIAAVLNFSELALRDRGLSERSREAVEQIRSEALRVRELVREMLDLARSERAERARTAPAALLERIAARMRALPALERIPIEVRGEQDLPQVVTDASRVEQVLTNLIENAAHALGDACDPRIELVAERAQRLHPARRRDDPPGSEFARGSASDVVALRVIDNGPGIDPERQVHVFDPFFTTKGPGEGTGLGLWNAHRIAELLGGRLELESAPGRTAFSLLLPAADRQAGESDAAPPDAADR